MTATAEHPTVERLSALQALLPEGALALITDLVDVRWLTGLQSSNAAVVVGADDASIITDFRYQSVAAPIAAAAGIELIIDADLVKRAAEIAVHVGAASLLVAKDKTTLADDVKLTEGLGDGIARVAGPRLVSKLRAVKTPDEIERIAAAQALADDAFREVVIDRGITGLSEREVALALEIAMRSRGAEAVSFEPIVAAGAHGALPHAHPRDVTIPKDELVVIDWGAQLDGYCSDCTRTVATGKIDEQRHTVHEVVRAAQVAALAEITAGADCKGVDGVARALIAGEGYGDYFGHGLGHGVGLEVHEGPTLSPRGTGELEAGNIVTVEPGIYLPGEFGVRVEELVVVTAGEPRVLTGLPREAILVG
ncbi:MAG: aminopeptidase P family protein [Solirubrobacteraceae bacterium]|nr:aminopeptidase P family protein [Solirubrobacteraceae bacterium]